MAQEIREVETLEIAEEDRITSSSSSTSDPSLSGNLSGSRLNARAPEFVPRAVPPTNQNQGANRVKIHLAHQHHHHHVPPPVVHVVYHNSPPAPVSPQFIVPYHHQQQHQHPSHDYYGGDHDVDLDQRQPPSIPGVAVVMKDGLSEDVTQKITKQVEYYFSDANLATTEHLMRFITKDPEGFVPISVIASFKKIKALVHNNSMLADALRTSSKLVVSEDGKKVRRLQTFTESDVEELQSRIIVAENLPDDHCYQSLMKVFSVAGSVKTIRTCYPQMPNGTTTATNRSSKLDMLFSNKLHAFVEYETVDDAEKAVAELNDERNWRSGLRVRLLSGCMVPSKQAPIRGRKSGVEGDGNVEEDPSPTNQPKVKQLEQEPSQIAEVPHEHTGEDILNEKETGSTKRGKGRVRGGSGRGRGRGHHHNSINNYNNHHRVGGGHAIGTPPSNHSNIHNEQAALVSKQPPGPRMPDGTRGFTMGRGKLLPLPSTSADV